MRDQAVASFSCNSRGYTAYVFITHDLAVVRQIAHEVLVLEAGRIVEHGTVDDVLGRPQLQYTKMLLDSTPRHGWTPRPRPVAVRARIDTTP